MTKELTTDLLKISQLAKATDTNVTTLKYYVKEGLIQPVFKTTKNMAYYSHDCIQRVNMIRSLQKEHFYPLAVIKGLLDSASDPFELEFMDAIHKADLKDSNREYLLNETIKLTGLSKSQIDYLKEYRIISSEPSNNKAVYTFSDIQIMRLVKRRIDSNIPFEESVKAFLIYQKALDTAAKEDVDCFIKGALLTSSPSASQAARMIGASDDTLDTFVSIKRSQLNRKYGSERIRHLHHYANDLLEFLNAVSKILKINNYSDYAEKIEHSGQYFPKDNDDLSQALKNYYQLINNATKSLAKSISLINQAKIYFDSFKADKIHSMEDFLIYTLKLGWFSLAPNLLDYQENAKALMDNYLKISKKCGDDCIDLSKEIIEALEAIFELQTKI